MATGHVRYPPASRPAYWRTLAHLGVAYPRWMRGLSVLYPVVLGGVVSALLIAPIGLGGESRYGAWLYVGIVIAVVTFLVDRLLRMMRARRGPTRLSIVIPALASCVGIMAGWWAVNYTMGGPT